MYSLYLSLSSGSPENFFKPLKVHSKNLAVVDGEGGDPPPFTTNKQDLCEEDDDGENEADLDDAERDVLALFTFLPIGPG